MFWLFKRILLIILFFFISTCPLQAQTPGLKAGAQAPDFQALNFKGETIQLSDQYRKGPTVLLFYRGGWCMFCNLQLQEYQKKIKEFEELEASIVAVSVDTQPNATQTVEEKELDFEVVSNPRADLLELYNVIYQVPADLAQTYLKKYKIDLEKASGRSDRIIAIPATYIIDQNGKIIYANANEDYKTRPSADEILGVIAAYNKE